MRDVISYLPDVVWYLSTDGRDMWCRVPYTFFFSTSSAASAFATEMKTGLDLQPVGIASKELISEDGLQAMRKLSVTRVFLDPAIDPETGDVHGRILRIEALQ